MSAAKEATPKRDSLTSLPLSVRNTIYQYTLDTTIANLGLPNVSYTHSLSSPGILVSQSSRTPFPLATSLFYLSRALSYDALTYFYACNLFVRLELYTDEAQHAKTLLEESGLLFYTAAPQVLLRSTRHAMDVALVEQKSTQRRATVMFPAAYLPRLVTLIDAASSATAAWAPTHALTASVLNVYHYRLSQLQADLLEPFRCLTKLGRVAVEAEKVLPRYAEGLCADMTARSFEAESWLASLTELAGLADAARESGDDALAREYGETVTTGLTYGYLRQPDALHRSPRPAARRVSPLRGALARHGFSQRLAQALVPVFACRAAPAQPTRLL